MLDFVGVEVSPLRFGGMKPRAFGVAAGSWVGIRRRDFGGAGMGIELRVEDRRIGVVDR